jgi:hypothetical protein
MLLRLAKSAPRFRGSKRAFHGYFRELCLKTPFGIGFSAIFVTKEIFLSTLSPPKTLLFRIEADQRSLDVKIWIS